MRSFRDLSIRTKVRRTDKKVAGSGDRLIAVSLKMESPPAKPKK